MLNQRPPRPPRPPTPLSLAVAVAALGDIEDTLESYPELPAEAVALLARIKTRLETLARVSSQAGRHGALSHTEVMP